MIVFGLKQGQDLENLAAHPHHECLNSPLGEKGGDFHFSWSI